LNEEGVKSVRRDQRIPSVCEVDLKKSVGNTIGILAFEFDNFNKIIVSVCSWFSATCIFIQCIVVTTDGASSDHLVLWKSKLDCRSIHQDARNGETDNVVGLHSLLNQLTSHYRIG
jgi:hypothetical protein